jgi:hypothetical protein
MHPLAADCSSLKDSEIESKIQDLSKKYWMIRNPDLQSQVISLLEHYKMELSQRRAKLWQDQNEKRDTDLDKLININ